MENQSLSEIIQETLAAQEPTVETEVNQEPEEELEDTEVGVDDLIADLVEEEDDEAAEESEVDETVDEDDEEEVEDGDEDPDLGETYQVKVDGEVVEVTLKEALAGYQRQADYTRKAQALSAEKEQFEKAVSEVSDALSGLQQLDSAWEENPISVLTHFAANTENPTHSVALLIKELASADLLDKEFLEMFGITNEIKQSWSKESEVNTLRRKVSKSEQERQAQAEQEQYEAEVQEAMVQYERQIDNILQAEGLKLKPVQRDAFRTRLAQYAFDNELTNLEAAYKALKYEETQKKKAVAAKTKERAKQKKAASAVGRSGASAAGASPVSGGSSLEDIIRQSMKELSIG